MGKTFIKTKQWEEAVKTYDKALKRLPESSLLRQNRAFCLDQLDYTVPVMGMHACQRA